jgi:IMP cyclohydrolase
MQVKLSIKNKMSLKDKAQRNWEHFLDNPCRGIVLGLNEVSKQIQISWIMGRSSNSQNRLYVVENNILKTEVADESKVEDPRLIIYNAMKSIDNHHVVSNGVQTDSIIEKGDFFGELKNYHCEPDAPTFTPRISGYQYDFDHYEICLSVLKADPFAKECWIETEKRARVSGLKREDFAKKGMSQRQINDAYLDEIDLKAILNRNRFPTIRNEFTRDIKAGYGYCITTYMPGSKELDSFQGEPLLFPMNGSLEKIMEMFWMSLEPEWKVSLGGREVNQKPIRYAKPINKFQKVR